MSKAEIGNHEMANIEIIEYLFASLCTLEHVESTGQAPYLLTNLPAYLGLYLELRYAPACCKR